MLRCVLIFIVACASISDAIGQQGLRVYPVDLYGNPISDVDVRVKIGEKEIRLQNQKGIATAPNAVPIQENGEILVNAEGINNKYIRRKERFNLEEGVRFTDGIVIPLWTPGEVKSLATAWVRNPDHIAIAVQRPASPGEASRIIMELDQDVDEWICDWAPDLPQVVYPELARALYAELEPGEQVPSKFDAALQRVWDEVDRQNDLARICRNQVARGEFPPLSPPQQPPNVQQPPENLYPGLQGYSGLQGYPSSQGYPPSREVRGHSGFLGHRGFLGHQGYPESGGVPVDCYTPPHSRLSHGHLRKLVEYFNP